MVGGSIATPLSAGVMATLWLSRNSCYANVSEDIGMYVIVGSVCIYEQNCKILGNR